MVVFFDNSILKNICKLDSNSAKKFETDFSKIALTQGISHPFFVSTALMCLEYAGFKIPPLSMDSCRKTEIKKILLKEPFDASVALAGCFDLYQTWLSEIPELNNKSISEKMKSREAKYRSPWAKMVAEQLFIDNLDSTNTYNSFVQTLAFDELQGYDLREIYGALDVDNRVSLIASSLAQILIHENRNFSLVRIVNQFFRSGTQDNVKDLVRQCDYKFDDNYQDRLDTQFIHAVSYGYFKENKLNPVYGFTMESENRTVLRSQIYMYFLAHLKRNNLLSSEYHPMPGKVFVVAADGAISAPVDLESLFIEGYNHVQIPTANA